MEPASRQTNPDAFDLILRARALALLPETKDTTARAVRLYERALARDPNAVLALTCRCGMSGDQIGATFRFHDTARRCAAAEQDHGCHRVCLHGLRSFSAILRLNSCIIASADRDGVLVDVMLSEYRNLAAAKRFFRSAKAVTGAIPDRITTDGHDAYPRAIRTELGSRVRHRTNCCLNNRLEQNHRGIKGRCRPMLGFKSVASARRFCRGHDELRNFLRSQSRMCEQVPAATRRFQYMRRVAIVLGILEAA